MKKALAVVVLGAAIVSAHAFDVKNRWYKVATDPNDGAVMLVDKPNIRVAKDGARETWVRIQFAEPRLGPGGVYADAVESHAIFYCDRAPTSYGIARDSVAIRRDGHYIGGGNLVPKYELIMPNSMIWAAAVLVCGVDR